MDKILRDKKAIFVFIAPALIMFLLVLIIPTIQMVYYSLCDYAALTPPEFVGLKNYKKLFFGDATFRIALKNSIFFMIFQQSHSRSSVFYLLLCSPTSRKAATFSRTFIIFHAYFPQQHLDFSGPSFSIRELVSTICLQNSALKDLCG